MHIRQASEEEALAHYGVKGMRWGVRKKDETAGETGGISEKRQAKASAARVQLSEVERRKKEMDELGITSPHMREQYGKALDQSDRMFAFMYGQSKESALRQQMSFADQKAKTLETRAEQLESGRLTSNQKKAIVGGIAAAGVLAYVGYASYSTVQDRKGVTGEILKKNEFFQRYEQSTNNSLRMTKQKYESMSTEKVRVPKGTVFQRMTAHADEKLSEGRMYVTHTQADADRYQGIYGPALRARTKSMKLHVTKMRADVDIVSPSEKDRVSMYLDLLKDPTSGKDFRKSAQKLIGLDDGVGIFSPLPGHNRMSDEDFGLSTYRLFASHMYKDQPASHAYFRAVKDAGYNALLDDNDRGQLSDSPMILLNAAGSMTKLGSERLTSRQERRSRNRLTELENRQ
jgi:hypothetical protein